MHSYWLSKPIGFPDEERFISPNRCFPTPLRRPRDGKYLQDSAAVVWKTQWESQPNTGSQIESTVEESIWKDEAGVLHASVLMRCIKTYDARLTGGGDLEMFVYLAGNAWRI